MKKRSIFIVNWKENLISALIEDMQQTVFMTTECK